MKWRLWLLSPGVTALRGERKKPWRRISSFLSPVLNMFLFLSSRLLQSTKYHSVCVCVPCDRDTLGSVPFRCSKYLSLMQPRAVADPSPGLRAQESTAMPLPLSANIWSRQQPEVKSPIQTEIPAEGWLCTRLNLFKEFTVIETGGGPGGQIFFLQVWSQPC